MTEGAGSFWSTRRRKEDLFFFLFLDGEGEISNIHGPIDVEGW